MEQRLTIITLGVKDLISSSKFYQETIGWKRLSSSNENISFFKLNGLLLSLYSREKLAEDANISDKYSGGFRGMTLAYNCRSKEEVDQTMSTLRKAGVKIVKEPQEVFWGGYSGYFVDPDENAWEVAYNPFLKLEENGDVADED